MAMMFGVVGDGVEAVETDLDAGTRRIVVEHDGLVDGVGNSPVVRGQLTLCR